MSRSFAKPVRRAFTLIEILTATSIMVVLLLIIITIAANIFNAYDAAISKLATTSDSRNVLGVLEQDLQSAIIRNDGNVWMQVEHPQDIGNVTKGAAPYLMFFSVVPDRPKREGPAGDRIGGDVCAVAYQIRQRSPFSDPGDPIQRIYGLYRAIVDSKATFETALPIVTGSGEDPASRTIRKPKEFWDGSAEVLDINGNRVGQSVGIWSVSELNFQAANVVELSLVFWYYDIKENKMKALVYQDNASRVQTAFRNAGLSDVQVVPYNTSLCFKAGKVYKDGEDVNSEDAGTAAILKRIDISTTILSPSGSKELCGLQQNSGQSKVNEQTFRDIVQTQGHSFTTSVNIYQ